MIIFFAGVIFYTIFFLGLLTAHFIRLRWAKQYEPTGEFAVAVIVPCKGIDDPFFEQNLVSIINQVYDGPVRFVFSLESETDPATPILRTLERQFDQVQVCVAGLATRCAQKVFNTLQGMACVPDADIFLFADADIQPHPTWLREMAAPFRDPEIGAVTGYYRRLPLKPDFQLGDYLAGLFAAVLNILQSDDRFQALWGGSMALRKSVINQYGLAEYLATEIVDDMALMQILQSHRIKRHYVPSCTVKSYCDMSVQSSIEWLVRQFQYLQIYFKGEYWLFVVIFSPYVLLMLATFPLFVYGLISQNWAALAGNVGFWLMTMLVSWLLRLSVTINPASVAPTDPSYRPLPWILAAPVAMIVAVWALLKTMLRVKDGLLTMDWRGIEYRVNVKTGQVVQIIR